MLKKNVCVENIDIDGFFESIFVESKKLSAKRFNYTVSKADNSLSFGIVAEDPVALKSAESSVRKLEIVFRKMVDLSGGENV